MQNIPQPDVIDQKPQTQILNIFFILKYKTSRAFRAGITNPLEAESYFLRAD